MAALGLLACTPTFNWREVPVGGSGWQALFPCKPLRLDRPAQGVSGASELFSCRAEDWVFGVGHSTLADAAQAPQALGAMRSALAANARGREVAAVPVAGPGVAPGTLRVSIRGTSPDGAPLEIEAQLFADGERLVQASIFGSRSPPPEAASSFFDGLRRPAPR